MNWRQETYIVSRREAPLKLSVKPTQYMTRAGLRSLCDHVTADHGEGSACRSGEETANVDTSVAGERADAGQRDRELLLFHSVQLDHTEGIHITLSAPILQRVSRNSTKLFIISSVPAIEDSFLIGSR